MSVYSITQLLIGIRKSLYAEPARYTQHPEAEQPLKARVDEASKAEWKTPAEIKEQYRSASILKNRRVVFNIKGNDYWLIVAIAYQRGWMFIKFIDILSTRGIN